MRWIASGFLVVLLCLIVIDDAHAADPQEEMLAQALADLPEEWGITRDHFTLVDCSWVDEGRTYTQEEWEIVPYGWVCAHNAVGAYFPEQRHIALDTRALGMMPNELWYETIIHEAVHFAHHAACRTEASVHGINRDLLRRLGVLFQRYVGARWHGDICHPQQHTVWDAWGDHTTHWETLPLFMRPVNAYATWIFNEYVAETIEDWYFSPRWLRYTDPHAHLAIDEHGLVAR